MVVFFLIFGDWLLCTILKHLLVYVRWPLLLPLVLVSVYGWSSKILSRFLLLDVATTCIIFFHVFLNLSIDDRICAKIVNTYCLASIASWAFIRSICVSVCKWSAFHQMAACNLYPHCGVSACLQSVSLVRCPHYCDIIDCIHSSKSLITSFSLPHVARANAFRISLGASRIVFFSAACVLKKSKNGLMFLLLRICGLLISLMVFF